MLLGLDWPVISFAEGMFGVPDDFANHIQRLRHSDAVLSRREPKAAGMPRDHTGGKQERSSVNGF